MYTVEDLVTGEHKIVSRSKARVIDNEDPQKKGRIRVFHPLTGETGFIPYLSVAGSFSVPSIDDVVYVEADAGSESHLIAWGNLNKEKDGTPQFPDVFQRVTPTNRGFFTPAGHLIELDDGKGPISTGAGVRVTTAGGNKITILEDLTAPEGLITVESAGGANIVIDGTKDKITAGVVFGDTLELSAAVGFKTTTPAAGGTELKQSSGKVTITGAVAVTLQDGLGGELKISGGKVALGGSTAELLDLFDQDLDAFINNAPTLVATAVGPGSLNPAVVTLLTTIKTFLTTIKGSL